MNRVIKLHDQYSTPVKSLVFTDRAAFGQALNSLSADKHVVVHNTGIGDDWFSIDWFWLC